MKKLLFAVVAVGLVAVTFAEPAPGQLNQIGDQISRGLNQVGDELSQAWGDAKQAVERMGLQGRVYARLHWDKGLQGANLHIDVRDKSTVVLTGTVPTDAAKLKAGSLTSDTIGVAQVANDLTIATLPTAAKPAR
jgi:osmotically-inducible protein OsmY